MPRRNFAFSAMMMMMPNSILFLQYARILESCMPVFVLMNMLRIITFLGSASMPMINTTVSLTLSIPLVMLMLPIVLVNEIISILLPCMLISFLAIPEIILPPVVYRIKQPFLM